MGGGSTVGRDGRREHSRERWEEGAQYGEVGGGSTVWRSGRREHSMERWEGGVQ